MQFGQQRCVSLHNTVAQIAREQTFRGHCPFCFYGPIAIARLYMFSVSLSLGLPFCLSMSPPLRLHVQTQAHRRTVLATPPLVWCRRVLHFACCKLSLILINSFSETYKGFPSKERAIRELFLSCWQALCCITCKCNLGNARA